MIQFNTVEEALEELKKGRIILVDVYKRQVFWC